jgi:RNA polymerase sigma-70 factor, ECF subfamily
MHQSDAEVAASKRGDNMDDRPGSESPQDAWHRPWPESQADLAALVEAYADRLVRYAFRQVSNRQDAEDVVQDVFVRALACRSKDSRVSAVGPYLYRSVANACTDLLRRRNCAAVFRDEVAIDVLLGGQNNPAEVVQAAEGLQRAERLLGRLPAEQAEVIRLRVFDELRLSQIAEVVGCPMNTVCSRLRYGFKKLRTLVAEQGKQSHGL